MEQGGLREKKCAKILEGKEGEIQRGKERRVTGFSQKMSWRNKTLIDRRISADRRREEEGGRGIKASLEGASTLHPELCYVEAS